MERIAIQLSGDDLSPDALLIKEELEEQAQAIFGKKVDVPYFVPPPSLLDKYMALDLEFITVNI